MTLTAKVLIDWDNDRLFNNANSDVSADLIDIPRAQLGKMYGSMVYGRVIAGVMQVRLYNSDGKYSNYLATSPIFGLIRPRRRVRWQLDVGAGYVTRWEGWLDKIDLTVRRGGLHTATLSCVGVMVDFNARRVYAPMQTSILTGTAAEKVFDAMEIPKLYDDQVLGDSPVGYWRLNEASGNALDETANGNDGTVTGATQGATGLLGADESDDAYEFDGASGDIDFLSPSELDDIFAAEGSIEAWINADSDGETYEGRIFDKSTWRLFVEDESAGALRLQFEHDFSTTGGVWQTTNRVITVGQTHHIVVTYNRDLVTHDPQIYVDGALVAVTEVTTPVGTASSDAASNLIAGNRAADDRTFDGRLDELALYNGSLTLTQVRQHHIAGRQLYRVIDAGQTTIGRWFSNRELGMTAMRKIENTEFGNFHENSKGQVVFEDRNNRLTGAKLTSQATFTDTTSNIIMSGTQPGEPIKDVTNIVRAQVNDYSTAATAVLWTLQEVPSLAPGESRTFIAEFPLPGSDRNIIGADPWTLPLVATTDYTGNTQADGLGTDRTASLSITSVASEREVAHTVTNNHATDTVHITLLQTRGDAVSKNDPVTIEVEDEDSRREFGPRDYLIPSDFLQDSSDAKDYADFVLQLQKDPHPKPIIQYIANMSAAMLTEATTREISDRVTYSTIGPTNIGINEEVYVEGISYRLSRRRVLDVQLVVSSAEVLSSVIILDTGPGLDTGILGR